MEQDQRLTPLPKTAELRPADPGYASAYPSFYDDESVDGKVSIRQYLDVVYKRLPLILALVILVTAATAFYMFRQPDEFRATTQMLIEPRRPKMTSKDSININFGQDANYYNTQLQLLRGPELMKDVVIKTGLYRNPDAFGNQSRGIFSIFQSIFSSGTSDSEKSNTLPTITDVDASNTKDPIAILTKK